MSPAEQTLLLDLIEHKALDDRDADKVTEHAHTHGCTWVHAALTMSLVPTEALALGLSRVLGHARWTTSVADPELLELDLWDPAFCMAHRLLAWRDSEGGHHIATADPTNLGVMTQAQARLDHPVRWWVAAQDELESGLHYWQQRWEWQRPSTPMDEASDPAPPSHNPDELGIEDVPVVKLLHELMSKAHRMRASDLHIEPYEHHVRVRWRIDGHLHEMCTIPLSMRDGMASRLKVLARLDIADKRLPQDGRIQLQLNGETVHGRVNSLPTLFGEKLVVRLLPNSPVHRELEELGMEPLEHSNLAHALARPQGMVLVTGPTGSGKTVTLYACLQRLNQAHVNIATAEDPCEIHVSGINQLQVHEKAGLTFATALRAFLRQDPDILMIGEIRDMETADVAIKAAQTGHLVLSTLHTNDAPATLTRLLNMGVAAYNVVASVKLVVAQRLLRRLCPHCKRPSTLTHEQLLAAGAPASTLHEPIEVFEAVGCARCHQGFHGRFGLYQTMPMTDDLQALVLQNSGELALRQAAQAAGIRSLRTLGLIWVQRGQTTLGEVLLNTPD
ncbi:MAG: type pilus assembly ATPase PilB [Pseudomonadota bacterium]|jgi:type IV pilus assembly protein PilB